MLSGVGMRSHLKEFGIKVILDLPVGDNYKEHINYRVQPGYSSIPLSISNLGQLYYNYSGDISVKPSLNTYMSTNKNSDKDWPNFKLVLITSIFNSSIESSLIEMQRVRSRGTIRLQSISPYIPPMITTNFLSDPRDFEDSVDAIRFYLNFSRLQETRSFLPQFSFERVGCQSCPGVEDYLCSSGIKCIIMRTSYNGAHSGCSCRMGAVQRRDVVVDPCLRVKNTRNLRVCDASIFPDLPNANTNAATNMVGEKCADLIKADHFIG